MIKACLRFGLFLGTFICLACSVYARLSDKKNNPFSFQASYFGENANNILGGIKTGSVYLGMVNLNLGFDTEKAGLWKGGWFYINTANTHGAQPSQQLIGDVQVVSNIEAGNHTYLQELWYKQQLNRFVFTLGLQDLNVEFANSEYAQTYLNSSFGILPIISNNFNASIFPLTTMGLTFDWNISKKIRWINALYDGSTTNFDYNPYNLKWRFNSGEGLLIISEIQKYIKINDLPGTYKFGAYCHFHRKGGNVITPDSLTNRLVGIYSYVDQAIWAKDHRNAGVFVQLGYSPSFASTNNLYFGTGINFTGLLSKNGNDILGLACAHVIFTRDTESETAIELTYQYQLTKYIFIQPDSQFVIHPAGTNAPLPNALAAILRMGISF